MTTATKAETRWPKVGDTVWFRMSDEVHGYEWRPATVVDRVGRLNVDKAHILDIPFEGTVHLAVQVDRKRHHSAASIVHRVNVPGPYEGPGGIDPQVDVDAHGFERKVGPPPGCGMWAWEKPEWADEQTVAQLERRRLTKHYWRENHKTNTTASRRRGGGRRMRQPE